MNKSAADKLREKAERLRAASTSPAAAPAVDQHQAQADAAAALAPPERRVAANVRTTPVRSTVDLSPTRHQQLAAWRTETASMLGRSRVTTQEVFRALVGLLLTDETLARRVRDELGVSGDK